jgi:hypothetical protein
MADDSSPVDADIKRSSADNGNARGRLRWSTKVFVAGVGLFLLVLAVGKVNTFRLERREGALETACRTSDRLPPLPAGFKMDVSPEKIPAGANFFDQFDERPPSWALADVRSKYPQLRKLSDDQLIADINEKYPGEFDCDAKSLMTADKTVGIQRKITEAEVELVGSEAWPVPLAIGVLLLFCVPWAWYALLRRIGELRAAIGGNPPER